jgi:predicted metal-dependent hydrolase
VLPFKTDMPSPSTHHYDDGIHRFDYTVILKPRLKHRYIRIRNGEAIVTAATRTSARRLEAFVTSKAAWIAKHLDEAPAAYDLARPGTQLYWRGHLHEIEIEQGTRDRLRVTEGIAHFTTQKSPEHLTLLALLHRHHKQQAPDILLPRIKHWSAIMDLYPSRVTFRRARTRWGSCSSRNALSLNTHLLMLPEALMDYVIVHELAHIRHKNHSKRFWDLVEKYLPKWQQMRKSIRVYEKYLI